MSCQGRECRYDRGERSGIQGRGQGAERWRGGAAGRLESGKTEEGEVCCFFHLILLTEPCVRPFSTDPVYLTTARLPLIAGMNISHGNTSLQFPLRTART